MILSLPGDRRQVHQLHRELRPALQDLQDIDARARREQPAVDEEDEPADLTDDGVDGLPAELAAHVSAGG
jgi:hypothetical protein